MKVLRKANSGFVMPTIMSFIVVITILGVIVIQVALQSQSASVKQQYIQQAQLASTAAMDFAKEQYESDIGYTGTDEIIMSINSRYISTYQVVSEGYTNLTNTQQQITATGRVYDKGDSTQSVGDVYSSGGEVLAERQIRGNLTREAGSNISSRFIFIIDNSGSMSTTEWSQSKGTVDIAINYVLSTVPTAEIAVVQYGTNHYNQEHKYDVTVPFTQDPVTSINWDRRYGHGTTAYWDLQDHLAASLAVMRQSNVYGPGGSLDMGGATNVQYILFTDAAGTYSGGCCTSLKRGSAEPSYFFASNGSGFNVLPGLGEFNALKDGTVFADDGYPGLTAQFTVLNINQSTSYETIPTSAAIASPGGEWNGDISSNPDDPEGDGILPRRYINDSLAQTDPNDILAILDEIFEQELNI